MTGFLNLLAGMALGATPLGAAHVSLPSRFARPSSAFDPGPQQLGEFVDQTERRSAPTASPQTDGSRDRSAPDGERARLDRIIAPGDWRDDRPPKQPAREAVLNLRGAGAPQMLSSLQSVGQYARPQPLGDPATRPVGAGPPTPVDRAEPQPRSNPRPTSAAASPAVPSIPRLRAQSHQAPLSDAAVAGRAVAARHERPVIHVTIDRIDVRAPSSPAVPKPQRCARPQPTVSLSDYLREGGKAGRQ
ncbi:hypothetical protein GALL_478960 [mine drainage metagenome]|uniref:Uncharacterized protein n=1 Tax=mine drainage metagenome TaxID=410659 RepID=A0A1J5PFU2_9ZZZZ